MEPSVEETGADSQPWTEMDSLAAGRSGQRPPTQEVLASLAAVRMARDAAQIRLRRDSHRVRLLTVTVLAAVAAAAFAMVGHVRALRRQTHAAAPPATITLSRPAPAVSPAAVPALANAVAPSSASATSGVPGEVSAAGDLAWADPEAIAARERAIATCGEAYNRHRWRSAAEACGAAFEAQSRDATLAMKVAQAQHARNHYAEAGVWARRAIALDGLGADVDPEAFVIVAHAERRARNPIAARTAYRRYLALAPRGWHAAEARAAVHPSRADRLSERTGAE